MKSLFGVLSLLVILMSAAFITGCQKEEVKEPPTAIDALGLDPNGAYFINPDGKIVQIDLDALQNNQELVFRNTNAQVNADFSWQINSMGHGFYKSHAVQINATQGNQGVNGSARVWRTWGDAGQNAYQIVMDAVCVESNGSDAVFTGRVGALIGNHPNVPSLRSRVWMRVKDNQQGPDQYKPGIIWNPGGTIPCGIFGLNSIFWNFVGAYENVANASDYITVN